MYTVGRLAKKFNLSRSTLLYYDSIGLLTPARRGSGEYRQYSENEADRLAAICQYREAGLSLKDIKRVLDSSGGDLKTVLERRLSELNDDIGRLRRQQQVIVGLLKNDRLDDRIGVMNRQTWTDLLEASGFSEEDMINWHVEFERHAPDKHQAFLEFLCIPEDEIEAIRSFVRV